MQEEEHVVPSAGISLSATLCAAQVPRAMVVFVPGAGPMDRNSNNRLARLDLFNTLAAGFAEAGISSLRYDKRGVGQSEGNYLTLTQAELVSDAGAMAAFAQRFDLPVFYCGHSEGTAIAVEAALAVDVKGLILLCPYITRGDAMLTWMAESFEKQIAEAKGISGVLQRMTARLLGGPVRTQQRLIRRARETDRPQVWSGPRRNSTAWVRDFLDADIAAVHEANTQPTLVIAAGRDCQCPPPDGAKIAAMNANATHFLIDDLSHMLRHTEVDGFADYHRQMRQPVDGRVLPLMTQWLDRQLASQMS